MSLHTFTARIIAEANMEELDIAEVIGELKQAVNTETDAQIFELKKELDALRILKLKLDKI